MKTILLTVISLLLLSVALTSCGKQDDYPPPHTAAPQFETTTAQIQEENTQLMIAHDTTDYIIVYQNDDRFAKVFALDLVNYIKRTTKVAIPCRADSETKESKYEILVGNTNRQESKIARERMGDHEYIITAVDQKIAVYAENSKFYEILFFRMTAAITNSDSISLANDFTLAADKQTVIDVNAELFAGARLSLDLTLPHKLSVAEVLLSDKYSLELSRGGAVLYRLDKQKTQLASSAAPLTVGKKYQVVCDLDDRYLRVYVNDPEAEIEPWPIFEVKLTVSQRFAVSLQENSGYGADFANPAVSTLKSDTDGVATYQNNIIEGFADPDILYHEGYYYVYVTGTGYPVYRSADLSTWEFVGNSLPQVSWNIDKKYMWAPDVEYINSRFYMAVSMGEAGFGIAVSDSVTGPFVCAGDMPFLTKTIDGHIFVDDDGRIYLYYTSWCNGRKYGIWGVEMEDDCLTPKWETEKLLFTPTEPWESTRNMGGVVEAPYMLKKEGVYYMVYSGSNYMADYAVGYATSTDPLNNFKKYSGNPILSGTADAIGTGHCSIITSPSGKMAMVYHVHHSADSVHPRHVAIDPIRFVKTEDGYILQAYGPTTSKRPVELLR